MGEELKEWTYMWGAKVNYTALLHFAKIKYFHNK